jgi:hypothetical protein
VYIRTVLFLENCIALLLFSTSPQLHHIASMVLTSTTASYRCYAKITFSIGRRSIYQSTWLGSECRMETMLYSVSRETLIVLRLCDAQSNLSFPPHKLGAEVIPTNVEYLLSLLLSLLYPLL